MKEIFCIILQGFLATKENVFVHADEISVDDDGVRLFDEDRCIAYFSHEIFRGVYRQLDSKINFLREGAEDENVACEN